MSTITPKAAFITRMRNPFKVIAPFLVVLLCSYIAISAQEKDPLDSITIEELRDQLFFLASDELEGRDTGSKGYAIAALYAVTQFKESALEPVIVGEDGIKTFFQYVPFSRYDISSESVFSIVADSGETKIFHGENMVVFRNPSMAENVFADEHPVFLGYGIDDPEIGWSDYDAVDVKGRVVFIVGGAPSKDGKPVFPEEKDRFYRNFGLSANARVVSAVEHGVSALVFVPDPEMAKAWTAIASSLGRTQFTLRLDESTKPDFPVLLFMHPDAVTALLENAGYEWTYGDSDYKPGVLENIKVSCSIKKDNEEEILCKNVVAMLPGTDPVLKEEYIVLHAHMDHIGVSGGQVMNGADDDASGCVTVLEVAEALAMNPAKRSFLFVLFTAEEKGLLGSEWFIKNPPVPQEKIVLNAAVDMIGRQSHQKPDVIYILAEGGGKERLIDSAKRANESRVQADIDFSLNDEDPDGHISRCDIRTFLDRDIPSLLFTRGFMAPVYHSPDDDADTIDYAKIEKASRLLYLVLREAADRN